MTEPEIDLHNTDNEGSLSPQQANDHGEEQASTQSTTTVVPSTETSSNENVDGTWGERDVGGPVSHRMAMEDFENMRRELSHISRSRSKSLTKSDHGGIFRTMTNKSRKSENPRLSRARDSDGFHIDAQAEKDIEAGDGASIAKHEEEFDLGPFIKDGHFEKRTENGDSAKKVGVVFKNLTVKGVGSKSVYGRTLPDAILGTFGPDLYRLTTQFVPILKFGRQQPTRILCDDFTGVVRNGEMMLVLGRPGSGCTTFLKAIANQRGDFAEVKGDVTYGGITAKRQHARYRGEVNYNPGKSTEACDWILAKFNQRTISIFRP